jgi:glycosyltransferase involved in cell wall biosynthesis
MKISICVINKNSKKTLEKSLRSVLGQIDDRFEVVVIDESTDDSPQILKKLELEFPGQLKSFLLGTQPLKSIGAARNMSIIKATGTYCIMHIDCDDIWFPYINYFADVFLEIEKHLEEDFLLAGHQINMAKRDFLLSVGPYQDIKHGEDRDLWMRLAKRRQYMPLDHVAFFERLPLGNKTNKVKAINRVYGSVSDEIRSGKKFTSYVYELFEHLTHLHAILKLLRILFYPIAKVESRKLTKIDNSQYFTSASEWNSYKKRHFGTFSEIALIWGFPQTLTFLSSKSAQEIFKNKRADKKIEEILIEEEFSNKSGAKNEK